MEAKYGRGFIKLKMYKNKLHKLGTNCKFLSLL